ncbi:hypothetical protein WA1_07160 [Scytonema hofmannii PCC 7110]|uniref:Uncharacterized protein n=1 Tax=Scytonema hofmannii PCC 7110 TaxID=128403 RepID=A0A139WT21_9CYAN|nr:hypothetical protein [Scytonema hofmannii]KYC35594.1 hypothetical protein WA1_07160 [Scytonema hofmannii PCC 7110]
MVRLSSPAQSRLQSSTYPSFASDLPRNLKGSATLGEYRLLDNWLNIQSINLTRHAKSLRPFERDEFGTSPAAPSEAHIEAVNRLLDKFRVKLMEMARWVEASVNAARREPTLERLQMFLDRKQRASNRVVYVEGIWDFYFDLFVQRLSSFGERLRAVDRIAIGCYEKVYTGLGIAKPTPTLLPFSYADSGFSPATFRRGVPLQKLRFNPNLFPLIVLPQHRLDNVWALSSVLHEVSHNLQADLGLWEEVPARIYQRLIFEGYFPRRVARTWANWHKEMMADMFALLLGGPAAVESLMDVVGRSTSDTLRFNPESVHPTPYLRVLINLILLRRLGLNQMAADLTRVWKRLYPRITASDIPPVFIKTFYPAAELVVDTMVFQRYHQFGNKSMAQVVAFGPEHMGIIELAGQRLAVGRDPGTIPVRLMISAARFALDRQLADPQSITDNFYRILGRR